MTNSRAESVYFNRNTNEVTLGYGPPVLKQPWICLSENASLGLVAIRQLLVEGKYVDDPRAVYWHFPQSIEETKILTRPEVPESEVRPRGPLARLREVFRHRGHGLAPR